MTGNKKDYGEIGNTYDKLLLSLKEASQFSRIGINSLKDISDREDCDLLFLLEIKE